MNRKKVCILSFSNIAWDSRVLREIKAAAQHYDVDVIGYGDWQPPNGVDFFQVSKTVRDIRYMGPYVALLLTGRLNSAAWERCFWLKREYLLAAEILKKGDYDLIHANDWDALPVAVSALRGKMPRVLFDAHEYSVEQGVDLFFVGLRAPFREYLLRKFGERAARVITVGEGISHLYRDHFNWESEVIMNAPYYIENQFRPVDPSRINLVHHGVALRGRYIEDMLSMIPTLDERFHLNLMLIPTDPIYLEELKKKAHRIAADRITFWDPVLPQNVVNELVKFDIGIPLIRVNTRSYYHALPNKFFEYTMAGLGIAISPLPDMQKFVMGKQTGIISKEQSWQSLSNSLNQLSAMEIDQFKRNSLELAKMLNAEVEMQNLMNIYTDMLNS